jgi:hypothetical protein
VTNRIAKASGEAFLGMFAEAIRAQQPPFLSVRLTERETAFPDPEPENPERGRRKEKLRGESAGSQDSVLAAGVYTTAILHLGALTPDVTLTDLTKALELANRAWWRFQEARAPRLGRTA